MRSDKVTDILDYLKNLRQTLGTNGTLDEYGTVSRIIGGVEAITEIILTDEEEEEEEIIEDEDDEDELESSIIEIGGPQVLDSEEDEDEEDERPSIRIRK